MQCHYAASGEGEFEKPVTDGMWVGKNDGVIVRGEEEPVWNGD